ncbi:2-hydroxymuconate tautomerase family protein [Bacillus salitolerans]|uniref:Tautomerase n=1 Tax=Bacillus salitolerans TaxID=1437434 RepID=A0ABW4LQI7_9BACI
MPIIQVQILEGRTDNQIRELIKELTDATVGSLHVEPNQVRVIVTKIPNQYWGVGGRTKADLMNSDQ